MITSEEWDMTTPSLHARLLLACDCAYEITRGGKFESASPYWSPIGFAADVQAILQGGINACLVGSIPEGILIAFRGTLYPLGPGDWIRDWAHDFDIMPMHLPGKAGSVHSGFWSALETLWPALTKAVDAIDPVKGRSLLLTGHSKGGALAILASWRAETMWNRQVSQVVTFASPRVGDGTFSGQFERLQINHVRFEYGDDIVPHLPPDPRLAALLTHLPGLPGTFHAFDYQHTGNLLYQPEAGLLQGDSLWLEADRLARLALRLAEGPAGLVAMAAAHARVEEGVARASHGYERAVRWQR
jgi:hypothetical protein